MTKEELIKVVENHTYLPEDVDAILTAIDAYTATAKPNVDYSFACQRSIEDEDKCEEQCDHCREYYSTLHEPNVSGLPDLVESEKALTQTAEAYKPNVNNGKSDFYLAWRLCYEWITSIKQPNVSGELLSGVDYWKQRCFLAEDCLKVSPCDPDITSEQIKAHNAYNKFISWAGTDR